MRLARSMLVVGVVVAAGAGTPHRAAAWGGAPAASAPAGGGARSAPTKWGRLGKLVARLQAAATGLNPFAVEPRPLASGMTLFNHASLRSRQGGFFGTPDQGQLPRGATSRNASTARRRKKGPRANVTNAGRPAAASTAEKATLEASRLGGRKESPPQAAGRASGPLDAVVGQLVAPLVADAERRSEQSDHAGARKGYQRALSLLSALHAATRALRWSEAAGPLTAAATEATRRAKKTGDAALAGAASSVLEATRRPDAPLITALRRPEQLEALSSYTGAVLTLMGLADQKVRVTEAGLSRQATPQAAPLASPAQTATSRWGAQVRGLFTTPAAPVPAAP